MMDEDQKFYLTCGAGLAIYLVIAYFLPIISWIIIIAALFCWFGG